LNINVKKANFRTSDRFRTLKTNNVDGPGKDENTPFVIDDDDHHEAEAPTIDPKIGPCVQATRGLKQWEDIVVKLTQ
jgi:hypothetical protein